MLTVLLIYLLGTFLSFWIPFGRQRQKAKHDHDWDENDDVCSWRTFLWSSFPRRSFLDFKGLAKADYWSSDEVKNEFQNVDEVNGWDELSIFDDNSPSDKYDQKLL